MPVQSTAFSLGHDQALAKLYVSQLGREKNTEDLLKDIGTERTLYRAHALLSARLICSIIFRFTIGSIMGAN